MECQTTLDAAHARLAAAIECAQRWTFYETATWLSELYAGITAEIPENAVGLDFDALFPAPPEESVSDNAHTFKTTPLAISAFHTGEYRRCHSLLRKQWKASPGEISHKSMLICCHALFKALKAQADHEAVQEAERQRAAEGTTAHTPRSSIVGHSLAPEWTELANLLASMPVKGGFALFLQAAVAKHRHERPADVSQYLCGALAENPYLWCAWEMLLSAVKTAAELDALPLGHSFLFHCARGALALRLDAPEPAASSYALLQRLFPDATYLRGQFARLALAHGNAADGMQCYESIARLDAFRTDHLVDFSNALCAEGRKDAIGQLVMQAYAADPQGTTTAVLIANFFSAIKQHGKAVAYLHRALHRAPGHVAAWILLGHEYNALGNPDGAIFAFAKAGEAAPNDHRPWYGLGCTYDALNLEDFAAHFLRRAAGCSPSDKRVWFKLAEFDEKHERFAECVEAMQRAVGTNPETDAYVFAKLATVTEGRLGDVHRAIGFYERHLAVRPAGTMHPSLRSIYKKLAAYYAREGFSCLEAAKAGRASEEAALAHLRRAKGHIERYTASCGVAGQSLAQEVEMMRSVELNVLAVLREAGDLEER